MNRVILAIRSLHVAGSLIIKFLLEWIYGLGKDVGWKIPRLLLSAWPSLMCEWGDISYLSDLHIIGSLPSSF